MFDKIQQWATIATGLAAVAAFGTYYYQKGRDKNTDAADQISLFRKEVIPSNKALGEAIKQIDPAYDTQAARIRLTNNLLADITTRKIHAAFPEKMATQLGILRKDIKAEYKVLFAQEDLLNILEELAVRILQSKTSDHAALNSIKQGYVELVEENIGSILFHKDVLSHKNIYQNILELYKNWTDQTDPRTIRRRLEDWQKEVS